MWISKLQFFSDFRAQCRTDFPEDTLLLIVNFAPAKIGLVIFTPTALIYSPRTQGFLPASSRQICLSSNINHDSDFFLKSQSSFEVLSASRNGFTSYCWDFVSGNVALVLFALLLGYCLLVLSAELY